MIIDKYHKQRQEAYARLQAINKALDDLRNDPELRDPHRWKELHAEHTIAVTHLMGLPKVDVSRFRTTRIGYPVRMLAFYPLRNKFIGEFSRGNRYGWVQTSWRADGSWRPPWWPEGKAHPYDLITGRPRSTQPCIRERRNHKIRGGVCIHCWQTKVEIDRPYCFFPNAYRPPNRGKDTEPTPTHRP